MMSAGTGPCSHPRKVAFPTEASAAREARRITRVNGVQSQAYECPAGHWHVGRALRSVTGRGRRRQRQPAWVGLVIE